MATSCKGEEKDKAKFESQYSLNVIKRLNLTQKDQTMNIAAI